MIDDLEKELLENGSADFYACHKEYGYDILNYLFNIGKIRFNADIKIKGLIRITPTKKLLEEE